MNKEIKSVLERCTNPTEIKAGENHLKIFVGGRMIGVVSNKRSSTSNQTGVRNIIAAIKRADRHERASEA